MSEKKNAAKAAETEKVMTKYDLKMQRRKEEAAKAKKEELKGLIIGIVLVAALAAFVLSFPIRSYLAVNGQYIKVGGEKVTRLEFDMQYNITKNSYLEQMGSYLSMFGMTDASAIENMAYSDNMTFGDYFAQMTAEGIREQKGLFAKAKEAGFTHDTTAQMDEMKAALETAAKEQGVTLDVYVNNLYGSLATWNRVKPYLERTFYVSAYYNKVMEDNMPAEEEIQAEYEANTANYDTVDYHMTIIEAELPTTAPDGTVEKDEEGNEIPYEPTEEEIAAAMEAAYEKALEAEKTVATDGTEYTGMRLSGLTSYIKDFMADESRKAGDTTVVEIASSNRYWAVSFDNRYRDENPTYDFRMISSYSIDAQTILDEWKNGDATEDSFMDLAAKYDEAGTASIGGYYSGMRATSVNEEIGEWLKAGRAEGDTLAVTTESGAAYVVYYLAEGEPAWKLDATSALLNADMSAFMEEAIADIEIVDRKKNLAYLYIEEESSEEASASAE